MCIVMGADTALNSQPAASPGRYMQAMITLRQIFTFITILLCLLSVLSCNTKKPKDLVAELKFDTHSDRIKDSLNRPLLLAKVVSEIAKENEVRWTNAFTGEKADQCRRYEWLSKCATNADLFDLLESKYANVKAYSFLCLKDRRDVNLKPVVIKHLLDSTSFDEVSGCFGEFKRINTYFFEQTTGLFTKREAETYRAQISKFNSQCKQ
jgi:hypothetical protein